jgi:hypothetical protein
LQAKFEQIAAGLRELQPTIAGAEPEQVIVLETLTSAVDNVSKAASKIPGLEWLAERDLDEVEPEFGFQDEKAPEKLVPRRLYALFSNQQAMDQLVRLWRDWCVEPNKRASTGFGPFKNLFIHLRDIRRWSPEDRIADTGIREQWLEDVAVRGQQGSCLFELEFWFRWDAQKRQRLVEEVSAAVTESGGQLLDQAVIAEIRYHAVLAELPATEVRQTLGQIANQQYSRLLRCEGVMFFRPHGQSRFALAPAAPSDFNITERLANRPLPTGHPMVALLDGVPVANHLALEGRLVIDDPDNHSMFYQTAQQQHGTAIASLITHGDLNGGGAPLDSPVYVRPVLQPAAFGDAEITPPRQLLVDLVHRAVRRIFEGDGGTPPVAPSVHVINFSIGDSSQPFVREMSALGRLLDWLAWKYAVLFIVSTGNTDARISIALDGAGWQQLSEQDLTYKAVRAMRQNQARKRPLSPSESINCLTVGAVHADDCPNFTIGQRVDLLKLGRLSSPLSSVSAGFRRATKPEILMPGGRLLFLPPINDGTGPSEFAPSITTNAPGQLAACPGLAQFERGRVSYSCGTSNAAALASRCAGRVGSLLLTSVLPADCDPLDHVSLTVLLKTLLVHGAFWDGAARILQEAFKDDLETWGDRIRLIQHFLGYGEVDSSRCLSATDQRATLLGWSRIGPDQGHLFSVPLPPSLSATKELRRLTVTLGWLTPTNNAHKNYRMAQLFLKIPAEDIGTTTVGVDAKAAQRGTLEHRVFEGDEAKAFLDGARLSIQISCREDAGPLPAQIPYAVAASLEVGQTSNIAIYQEVRDRIRPQVEIAAEP